MNNMDFIDDCDEQAPINRVPIDMIDDTPYTVLRCRMIRIGSFKYATSEEVIFNANGIRLASFATDDLSRKVILHIQHREIVKILIHFGRVLPVIFIYTLPSCSFYVRKKLKMSNSRIGPYFDSCAAEEMCKRIILLPYNFTPDVRELICKIYGKPNTILDELTAREADEILTKISLREREMTNDIRQILIYPPGKGGISINTEDYGSLEQDKYLNDVIIDFYLKYLCNEVLTEEMRNKTHVFSTFFYTRLMSVDNNMGRADITDFDLSSAQRRYNRVKNWTKNLNIFEKDFIIIPINENSHWFLVIVCFPGLKEPQKICDKESLGNNEISYNERNEKTDGMYSSNYYKNSRSRSSFEDDDDSNNSDLNRGYFESENSSSENIKQPCILIFDSLAGGTSRKRVISTIRDYLTCEYQSRFNSNSSFDRYTMKGCCVEVPQQNNLTDCGLYLLQFVEHFFKVPITDYTIPIKGLENWFETIVVTRKREDISNLIKKLVADYNPDNLPLPDICFPTLNGKLIEQDTVETADEFKEHFPEDIDDEFEEEYNEEEDSAQRSSYRDYDMQHSNNLKRSVTESESESESTSPAQRRYRSCENEDMAYEQRR